MAFIKYLESPWLSVIAAGRPTGKFQDVCDRLRNSMHLYSQFPFGEGNGETLQGVTVAAWPESQCQSVSIGIEMVTLRCCPDRATAKEDFQSFGRCHSGAELASHNGGGSLAIWQINCSRIG